VAMAAAGLTNSSRQSVSIDKQSYVYGFRAGYVEALVFAHEKAGVDITPIVYKDLQDLNEIPITHDAFHKHYLPYITKKAEASFESMIEDDSSRQSKKGNKK